MFSMSQAIIQQDETQSFAPTWGMFKQTANRRLRGTCNDKCRQIPIYHGLRLDHRSFTTWDA